MLLALVACTGGQSGSEPQTLPPQCMCVVAGWFDHPPLRGVVTSATTIEGAPGTRPQRMVQAMLSDVPPDVYPRDIEVGEQIGGTEVPCGGPALAPGDFAVIYYARGTADGDTCVELRACLDECTPDDVGMNGPCSAACASDTAAACSAHSQQARMNGQLWVARAAGDWDFGTIAGEPRVLTEDELGVIAEQPSCWERFPLDP